MKQKRDQHSGMTKGVNETNGLDDVVLVTCGVTPCVRDNPRCRHTRHKDHESVVALSLHCDDTAW